MKAKMEANKLFLLRMFSVAASARKYNKYNINIQSSFTVKTPRVRLVEIGHMTTLCLLILHSLSAVIKSYNALQLLQLSIHSKTV